MQAANFLEKLGKIKKEDLDEIKGIGDVLAKNIVDFVDSDRYKKLIEDLKRLEDQDKGIQVNQKESKVVVNGPLKDTTVCITGTFEKSREQIKSELENLGAKVTDSVTNKTTTLLVGENPGSKVAKAEKMNIKIAYSVEELLNF